MRYLCRRLAHAVLVLVGVSSLTFAFAELAPGDVLDELRLDPRMPASTVAALREQYGLDKPLPEKYLRWVTSITRGELGFSVTRGGAVGPLLRHRARNTLLLTIPATVLAWCIAIPLGAWAASQQGGWGDRATAAATTTLLGLPDLIMGLGFLLIAVRTGWFPTGGMVSLDFDTLDMWARAKDVV